MVDSPYLQSRYMARSICPIDGGRDTAKVNITGDAMYAFAHHEPNPQDEKSFPEQPFTRLTPLRNSAPREAPTPAPTFIPIPRTPTSKTITLHQLNHCLDTTAHNELDLLTHRISLPSLRLASFNDPISHRRSWSVLRWRPLARQHGTLSLSRLSGT
jgi:hypothetical protein